MAENAFDLAKAIAAVTSGDGLTRREKAAKATSRYLSENPSAVKPVLTQTACALAVDPGAGRVLEIVSFFLRQTCDQEAKSAPVITSQTSSPSCRTGYPRC